MQQRAPHYILSRKQTKSLTANGTTYWSAVRQMEDSVRVVCVCVFDRIHEVCISEGPQVSGSTSILWSYVNHFVSVGMFAVAIECQEICYDGKKDLQGDLFNISVIKLRSN